MRLLILTCVACTPKPLGCATSSRWYTIKRSSRYSPKEKGGFLYPTSYTNEFGWRVFEYCPSCGSGCLWRCSMPADLSFDRDCHDHCLLPLPVLPCMYSPAHVQASQVRAMAAASLVCCKCLLKACPAEHCSTVKAVTAYAGHCANTSARSRVVYVQWTVSTGTGSSQEEFLVPAAVCPVLTSIAGSRQQWSKMQTLVSATQGQ